jgi:hypothetical protein
LFAVGNGHHVDGSQQKTGPLRFINQCIAEKFENCQFHMECGKVIVKTTKVVPVGCEFLINYYSGASKEIGV